MSSLHICIPVIGIVASIAIFLYHIFFEKAKFQKLGNCILPLTQKKSRILYPMLVFVCVIFALLFVRRFSLFIIIILTATCVLAVELGLRDYILQRKGGVYENGLITSGRFLTKEDFVSFPTLAYENDSPEASSIPPEMLKTVTKNNGVIVLEFANQEERNSTVNIIKSWVE